jgi:cytochrome P450
VLDRWTTASLWRRLALASAPWPLVRPCFSPAYARLHRRSTVLGGAYVVAYAAVVTSLALWSVWYLAPLAAAAAASTGFQAFRLRASYGRRARLPPGSLPLVSVDPRVDRAFFAKRIARYGPISKARVPNMLRPVVCIAGLERGASLLREHAAALEWVGMTFDPLIPAGFIRSMRPEDHRRYRRVLGAAFTDRVVEAREPFFATTARTMLASIAGEGPRADARPALARYTLTSLANAFFGVVPDTPEHALIEQLYLPPGPLYTMGTVDGPHGAELRRAATAMSELVRERAGPAGVQRCFLDEILRTSPEAIDDANVVLNLIFILGNGARDVTGLMHWIVKLLADEPGWVARLRADGSDDLASRVVMETLRLAQSEYVSRRAVAGFELDRYVVPAGWYVRVCVHEAHRDPSVFPEPHRFDPDRFLERRYGRTEYAPFGMQKHACLGATLTSSVAATFVRELAHGFDLRVEADGEPVHDGYHWRPSREHRITLVRAGDARAAPGRPA